MSQLCLKNDRYKKPLSIKSLGRVKINAKIDRELYVEMIGLICILPYEFSQKTTLYILFLGNFRFFTDKTGSCPRAIRIRSVYAVNKRFLVRMRV